MRDKTNKEKFIKLMQVNNHNFIFSQRRKKSMIRLKLRQVRLTQPTSKIFK